MTEHNQNDATRSIVPLHEGALISHYKLMTKLGAGGMGEVFVAEDTALKRKVALKFLSPLIASDETNKARFLREARSAAALSHPNIVTIFEVAEIQGRAFIAMEYIEGETLRDLIKIDKLPFADKVNLAIQLCEGLNAAHKVGLVHRDIKSSNVVVDKNRRARILDFGLAKQVGDTEITRAGTAMGTVSYMSPEQTKGSNVDQRSDIFSLGVVFYELFTGKLPFDRSNVTGTLYAIVNDPAPPLNRFLRDSPVELQRIIEKALAKKAIERYQDVSLLGNDLKSIFGQKSGQISLDSIPAVEKRTVKSLAVLYLRNLGSKEDDFLCYGITEDLIVDLTRIGTVRVAPMRAILKYKEADIELSEIAEKLNVDIVLDGSIHRSEKTIRVSAQLIEIRSGRNLWAERWQEPIDNLAIVKQSLAQSISPALEVGRTLMDLAEVSGQAVASPGAYENYLRAKYNFDHKKDTSDVEIALELYNKALKSEPELLSARAGIAEILLYQGESQKALAELESALAIAEKRDLKQEQANVLRLLARFNIRQSNWPDAWKYGSRALDLNRKLLDLAGEAETLGVLISALQPQAKFDESLELFDRVLEISRHLNDQEKIAESLKNMGVAYSRIGDYERALGLYEESLELARRQENLSLEAANLSNIGNVYYYKGDLNLALQYQQEACGINTRIGDHTMAARQNLNMGLIHVQNGELEKGLVLLRKSAETFEKAGERSMLAMNLINISQTEIIMGKIDEAIKTAESARQIAKNINHPLSESDANLH
ncbi:MAG: protein kinase domain-containing protein, partial [Candidatus Zixiibacteriota bacterium]